MAKTERIFTAELTIVSPAERVSELTPERIRDIERYLALAEGFDHVKIIKIQDHTFPDRPEAPKLTKGERCFCKLVETGYIARDKNGGIWWYENKPFKRHPRLGWIDEELLPWQADCKLPSASFNFIHWEDDEPWAVKDLLMLEVES